MPQPIKPCNAVTMPTISDYRDFLAATSVGEFRTLRLTEI